MASWLDSKKLAAMLGKSHDTATRIIKTHAQAYPACVRKVVPQGKKSRPYFEILWDTDTNQPATQADQQTTGETHEAETQAMAVTRLVGAHHCETECSSAIRGGLSADECAGQAKTTNIRPLDSTRTALDGSQAMGLDSEQPSQGLDSTQPTLGNIDGHQRDSTATNLKPTHGENESRVFTLYQEPHHRRLAGAGAAGESATGNKASLVSQNAVVGKPIHLSCALLALAEKSALSGERKAVDVLQNTVQFSTLNEANQAHSTGSGQGLDSDNSEPKRLIIDSNVIDTETGEVLHPDSFTCQVDQVERLIEQKGLIKQCRSTVLSQYFASIVPPVDLAEDWQTLSNNTKKKKFAQQHKLTGNIPARLSAQDAKKLRGRKSTVTDDIVSFIGRELLARTDVTNIAKFTPHRERNVERILEWVKAEFNQQLSATQVRSIINKHNFQCFLEPVAEEQKGGGKKRTGSWPRMPVCEIWLMDGVVPTKFYIRDAKGTGWTGITCIGIEDVGSRMMLGFKEYYSESGAASVHLFKEVFTNNTFKRGCSEKAIKPTLRPDQGSGFVSSMDGCAFAINELYAQKHHFMLDYHPAKAGTPTDKAHLESAWKFVHGMYINRVRNQFGDRIDKKSNFVMNHKTNKKVFATYFDITLEELRASGIAEQFRNDINRKRRVFSEDNTTVRFKPIDRWQEFLGVQPPGLNVTNQGFGLQGLDSSILSSCTFTATPEELIKLDIFGYPKQTGCSVRPQAGGFIVTYKTRKYVVQKGHSFSSTRSTEVRISVLPNGDLAIFTEKAQSSLGTEFLCLATLGTVGATGESLEKYHAVKRKKDQKLDDTVTKIKQASIEELMLAEFEKQQITVYLPTVKKLIEQGLSLELMQVITSNPALQEMGDDSEASKQSRFKRFQFEALKALQSTTTTAAVKRGVL